MLKREPSRARSSLRWVPGYWGERACTVFLQHEEPVRAGDIDVKGLSVRRAQRKRLQRIQGTNRPSAFNIPRLCVLFGITTSAA